MIPAGPAWHLGPALPGPCCVLAVGFCGLLLVGLVVAILDPPVHPVACLVLICMAPFPGFAWGPVP